MQPPPANAPAPPHARTPRPVNRVFNVVLTVAFLAAIAVPGLGTLWKWDFVKNDAEKRALAPFPALPTTYKQATRLTKAFSDWFTDHFGFRNTLIKGLSHFRYDTIGPTHTAKAIVGDDGWLFVRMRDTWPGGEMSFRLERGLLPFTDAELALWQGVLERRHAYLAARNIPYLVVIPPDKQSIYPEHFPEQLRSDRPTRLDQLIAWLEQKKSPVKILDLRAVLIAAKAQGELYRRTDSHWNDEGAYLASVEICAAIRRVLPEGKFPQFSPEPRDNLVTGDDGIKSGDLSALLNLENRIQERWTTLRRKTPGPVHKWQDDAIVVQTTVQDPGLPRMYLIRDSFTTALMPFLENRFQHIYTPLQHFVDERAIAHLKPDIVVTEFVERKLHHEVPLDTEAIEAQPLPGR